MDKNIPLSELIRIGAKLGEQLKGELCRRRIENEKTHYDTCAIGAAYLAKFGELPRQDWLLRTAAAARALGIDIELSYQIILRNDSLAYCLTREEIADWLEKQGL